MYATILHGVYIMIYIKECVGTDFAVVRGKGARQANIFCSFCSQAENRYTHGQATANSQAGELTKQSEPCTHGSHARYM